MLNIRTGASLLAMGLGLSLLACDKSASSADGNNSEAPRAAIKTLGVAQLEQMLAQSEKPVVYDANSVETRAEYGVIPGAKLLSSSRDFNVDTELPDNKQAPLVFYCGSTRCQAAEGAADKAVLAGYSDVGVMRDGIKGWAKAGKPTSRLN